MRTRRLFRFRLAQLVGFALLLGGCKEQAVPNQAVAAALAPAKRGLDAQGQMRPSEGDRCPVCAMDVTRHPKFASAIQLEDGSTYYFCGTGCLIKSWLHPEIFLARTKGELKRAVTREYFGGKTVDALAAHWVAGSDVVGPMGPALVPLEREADIETFKQRHGGKTTFKLSSLTDERWEQLTGKSARQKPPARR